jgi:hypothetical protein
MAITQRRQRSEHLKTVTLKNHKYAQRARRRFCKGTCFVAPVDLILTGKCTLEEWAAMLSEERELEQGNQMLNQDQINHALNNKPQI